MRHQQAQHLFLKILACWSPDLLLFLHYFFLQGTHFLSFLVSPSRVVLKSVSETNNGTGNVKVVKGWIVVKIPTHIPPPRLQVDPIESVANTAK